MGNEKTKPKDRARVRTPKVKRLRAKKPSSDQRRRETERRLANILENAAEAILALDHEHRVIVFNKAAENLFGYRAGEILGQPLDRLLPDRSVETHRQKIRDFAASGETMRPMKNRRELLARRKDGTEISVEIGLSKLEESGDQYYTATIVDITERKRAENALLKSEQVLRMAESLGHTGSWEQDLITGVIFNTEENLRLFFGDDRSKGTPFDDYAQAVHPDDREFVLRKHAEMLEGGPGDIEFRVVWPDGAVHVLFGRAVVVRDELNRAIRVYGTNVDITERKRAEEEIKRRADQFSLLYDAGLALNSILDPKAQLKSLFRIAQQALNADRAEFFRFDPVRNELQFEQGVGYEGTLRDRVHDLAFPLGDPQGLVGWIAAQHEPLNIPDLTSEPRYIAIDPALRSGIWIPILHQDRLLGVLNILSTRLNAFTAPDEQLLILFANQIAVAMENARLFEEGEKNLQRVQALREIDRTIASSLDLRQTMDTLLAHVVAQLAVDAAAVLVLRPQTQMLEFIGSVGFHTPALQHTHLRLGDGLAGKAALERKNIVISDLTRQMNGLAQSPLIKNEKFIAYFGVPLIVKGRVNGVMEIFHRTPLATGEAWIEYLETLAGQAAIAIDNAQLFEDLQGSNIELALAYDTTLEGWSRALDLRDHETEGHTRRVTEITLRLAREMGMSEEDLVHVRRGGLLHDIGKMGIPDEVLLKPGELTDLEWTVIRQHPDIAFQLLSPIAFLKPALDIPYCHHERWDGSGYPRGLRGEQIPLAARIFAVVDVWDALRSNRVYRPAWSQVRVREHIKVLSGTHFEPKVVDAFFKLNLES